MPAPFTVKCQSIECTTYNLMWNSTKMSCNVKMSSNKPLLPWILHSVGKGDLCLPMDGHVWWHCPHRWLCKCHGALKFTVYWAWQLKVHGTTVATQVIDMISICTCTTAVQWWELFCSHLKWKKHVDKIMECISLVPIRLGTRLGMDMYYYKECIGCKALRFL